MEKRDNSLNVKIKMLLSVFWISVLILIFLPAASGGNRFRHGMLSSLASGEELFTEASTCNRCHDGLSDVLGADVSYVNLWSTTMMRLSFIDPMWRAKVRSETIRIPNYALAIEKKCVRCHAPMASEQAIQDGVEFRLFENGFASSDNPYHGLAMDGISCTLCHQVTEFNQNSDTHDSGNFEISDMRVGWGPFFPQFASMMERNSGYWPEQTLHLGDSEFCAKCHDLFTDYVNAEGEFIEEPHPLFAEQTPYLEWLESTSAADNVQCQDCHMADAARTKIASRPRTAPYHDGVLRHTFFTENTMMLSIIESMADQNPDLDLPDLGDAINNGQEYLYDAGTIEIEDYIWEQNTLTVFIRVTNGTGHKLPTSIPVRRAFIHFAVYGQNEQVLFSSGDVDEEGRIIGVDADFEGPLDYEPHYDLISSGDQVQVYEGIMGNTDDEVTYTLLRASHFIKDNRILPAGFDKANADPRILPVGIGLDDNFIGGEDRITYQVSGISGSRINIVAELKDQTLSYPLMADLAGDASADAGGPIPAFLEEYEHHKVHFEIIADDSREIRKK